MHRGGHGFKNRAHQRMHFMSFCVETKACSCSYVRAIRQRPLIPQMQWVGAPHWPPSSRAQALAPIASQLMPRAFPEHQQIRRSICGCCWALKSPSVPCRPAWTIINVALNVVGREQLCRQGTQCMQLKETEQLWCGQSSQY